MFVYDLIVFQLLLFIGLNCAFDLKNLGSFCSNDSSLGPPNLNPIDNNPPKFVRSIENGSLYTIGSEDNLMWLVHVWGETGYDYGFAYGTLLKEQINKLLPRAWAHFEDRILHELEDLKLPKWFEEILANKGLAFALDFQNTLVEKYIDPEIYNEMKGISDAAGIDFHAVRRIHMIGEITRGRCSLYGLWGNSTLGGKTLQLRALDFDTDGGFQDYPVVTVYHPRSSKLGHKFANVAWAGYIGTLTGMSETRLGISEIGIYFSDDTFGDESMSGLPFIFVERYILQYCQTVDDALSFISNVKRTCRLILAVADGKLSTATMIQYSHSKVNFFDDQNLQPLTEWHPRIHQCVYLGMDWLCPSRNIKLYNQIMYQYGSITPQSTIKNITSVSKTGDLHVAIYDLTDNQLYVANAKDPKQTKDFQAYLQQFIQLDLNIEYNRTNTFF